MTNKEKKADWNLVYSDIAYELCDFYSNCRIRNQQPGIELYKLLYKQKMFIDDNSWLNKFGDQFGIKSIDPIHLFSSISRSDNSEIVRRRRIELVFRALKVEMRGIEINFEGCPSPNSIKLFSGRDYGRQEEVWDLFYRIVTSKRRGLKKNDFEKYKKWYGVDFSSLTTFLYWICSDSFLPIDKYTRTFLISTRFIQHVPKTYNEYISILVKIDKYNYKYNSIYGSKGIFREIAYVSYKVINSGSSTIWNSKQFHQLFKSKKTSDTDNNDLIKKATGLGFKIIAIKALNKCRPRYLNILKRNQIYYFEKAFEIKDDKVTFDPSKNLSLFDIRFSERTINLNITAVVGKNGSGKSSLVELLFKIINNIAYANQHILNSEELVLLKGLNAELYYICQGQLFCVIIKDSNIRLTEYDFNGLDFVKRISRGFNKSDFDNWFYTIGVNYSHYALNSNSVGAWIEKLFHKNDGYQIPLVISPMRNEGNIDINIENSLVKSRLMAILINPTNDSNDIGIRQITEKQEAIEIVFKRIRGKNKFLFKKKDARGKQIEVKFKDLKTDIKSIFRIIENQFKVPIKRGNSILIKETEKYIIRKLVRITLTYSNYSSFFDNKDLKFYNLEEYISLLKDDKSHITYKLRQAINYLKYPTLINKKDRFTINIDKYSKKIENFKSSVEDLDVIELLPPPIFDSSIILIDKLGKKTNIETLSSGEKQLIYPISSILYHIKYIDSVHSDKGDLISYKNINLFLDEIELYYHPEMQRKYLSYLISMIKKLTLYKIEAINICLITHSPYILSDIPNFYTLKLDQGIPDEKDYKTFGSNIHDLLKENFFLENIPIGEFAKETINETINFLNLEKLKLEVKLLRNKNKNSDLVKEKTNEINALTSRIGNFNKQWHKQIIGIIGEPVLGRKLTGMYDEFVDSQSELEKLKNQVIELEKRIIELE